MKVVAHRGYWETKSQQNTFDAIMLGLILSDGVEIDLRMYNGKIVVSHDHVAKHDSPLYFSDVLPLSLSCPNKLWALNIKEDGLANLLIHELKSYPNLNYFCFDMSFPETVQYIRTKLQIACRVSDLEDKNAFTESASNFYLLDGFKKLVKKDFSKKNVMMISPELHNRPFSANSVKRFAESIGSDIYVCTDRIAELC